MSTTFSADDFRFMALAIQLAKKGRYTTDPNPRVGCVLVKDGQIVGQGFHRKAGEPHAERMALADAGDKAKDATAYVTLEPCCHHGKTPPCTDGLIEANVSRVVAAMTDPNPLVAGQGLEKLKQSGVKVQSGLLAEQAQALNPGFVKRMQTSLPFVTCKLAMSLDGRTAMASGESVWISNDFSRRDVQKLRAASSAIVTGVGTVLADNPSMNVRLSQQDLAIDAELAVRQPMRVVLDPNLQTPADAKILTDDTQVMIFCSHETLKEADKYADHVDVVAVHLNDGWLDLNEVLQELARREVNEILLETGATLAGSALKAGLVDQFVIYQAPHLMGDAARGLFHLPGLEKMADRINVKISDIRNFDSDLRITATVES